MLSSRSSQVSEKMGGNQLRDWAEREMATLLRLGVDLEDAQASVTWVLANLPEGADPATWLPPAELCAGDAAVTPVHVQDARTDWYARESVPARFKRLLDAREAGDAD